MRLLPLPYRLALLFVIIAASASLDAQDLKITVQQGFGDAQGGSVYSAIEPSPVSLLLENSTDKPLLVNIALGSGLDLLGKRTLRQGDVISPGVGKQFCFLVEGGRTFEGKLALQFDRMVSAHYKSGADERWFQPTDQLSLELAGASKAGFLQGASLLVLGSRGRQLARIAQEMNDRRGAGQGQLELQGRPCGVYWLDEALAPNTWLGYRSCQVILWTDPDLTQFQDPAQLRALLKWVEYGGRLVLLGATSSQVLEDPQLKPLLPARVLGAATETYPLPEGAPSGIALRGPLLSLELGKGARPLGPRQDEAGRPFARPTGAEIDLGYGTISLAAIDPLVYDRGQREGLVQALAAASGMELTFEPSSTVVSNAYYYGPEMTEADALAGPLGNGNIVTPPLWLYVILAIFFVLLIGPIDYAILKKRGKLKSSAYTLLIYTGVFSGVCIGATTLIFSGNNQVNRCAVIDLSEDHDGRESGHGWVMHGIYTAIGGEYDLTLADCEQFGSYLANDGDQPPTQRFGGPGLQPSIVDLSFNSFRATQSIFSGSIKGGLGMSLEMQPDGKTALLSLNNGFATTLERCVFVWRNGCVPIEPMLPGESRTVEIPVRASGSMPPQDPRVAIGFERRDHGGFFRSGNADERFVRARVESHLLRASLLAWSTVAPRTDESLRRSVDPLDLTPQLAEGRGVFLALTDHLPLDDGIEDRGDGTDVVLIRKLLRLPPEFRPSP